MDDQRGGTVRHTAADTIAGLESDLDDSSVEGEGEDEQEDRNGEEGGSSGGGTWGWARDGRRFGPAWLVVATFVHEVWLLLQHANILLNPLCQRLDRSYGVGLVRLSCWFALSKVSLVCGRAKSQPDLCCLRFANFSVAKYRLMCHRLQLARPPVFPGVASCWYICWTFG